MSTKRVCPTSGCPTLVEGGGRCRSCRSKRERERGTRQQRGYDSTHDQLREAWTPIVEAGTVPCRRWGYGCKHDGPLIVPPEPWDLGHPDRECPLPRAPEHRDCNRRTSGR